MIAWDLRSATEHPAIDAGVAPEGFLSAPERAFFDRLKTPRRRREWLLGRWAGKALCRAFLAAQGAPVPASALTIAPDDDGSPVVLLPFRGRLPVTLSISHRDDLALAALVDVPGAPLGADLEKSEPRAPGFVDDFFTELEAQEIGRALDPQRQATERWSLKEAALKALRLGLTVDTRRVETTPRESTRPGWEAAAVEVHLARVRARGWAFVRDEGAYVASIAWLGAGRVEPPSACLRGAAVLEDASPPAGHGLDAGAHP